MMDRLLMKNRNSSFLRSKKKLPSIRRCGMSNSNNRHKYDDLINLPHQTSPTRPRMTMIDRAAQFSPFAALTGYDAAVKETARLTENRNRSIIPRYRKAVVPGTHTAENHDLISSDQGSRSSTSKSLLRSARSGNMLSR